MKIHFTREKDNIWEGAPWLVASHFENLARHFKVGNSNVIYYSVHVNTLVIKSAVHCLQLCTIIMIICETLFDDFRLLTSLSTWYNFTPGLYFLLPLEAIIIYTIFTSYRSRHVVFATTPSGMLRRTLSTPQSGGMALMVNGMALPHLLLFWVIPNQG